MTEEQMRNIEDQQVDELIARQFHNDEEEDGLTEAERPDFQLIVYYKGKNLRRIDVITGDGDTYGFHLDLVGRALLHYATEHAGDMIDDIDPN